MDLKALIFMNVCEPYNVCIANIRLTLCVGNAAHYMLELCLMFFLCLLCPKYYAGIISTTHLVLDSLY